MQRWPSGAMMTNQGIQQGIVKDTNEPCYIGREEVETRMKGTNGVNKNTKINQAATKEPTGEEMRKQIVERNVLRESKKVKQEGKKMVKRGKIKTLDSYFKKKLLVLK